MSAMIPQTAYTLLADVRRDLQLSKRLMFRDVYELWAPKRPAGTWERREVMQTLERLATGVGRLHANGQGGPISNEDIVFPESAYRLQTAATILNAIAKDGRSARDTTGMVLVVNGARLFRIDVIKPEDRDDLNVDIYLSELFDRELPEARP